MIFRETPIAGAWSIALERRGDARGSFARVWCADEFAAHGLTTTFPQANTAYSAHRGTLRGLHYQDAPFGEVKLMRCIRGAIFDVIVDLRPGSASYLRWYGTELSAESGAMLYVPVGCAHGYLTLADETEVFYPVSTPYTPSAERGVRFDDPSVGIEWPASAPILHVSDKDRAWPDMAVGALPHRSDRS